MAGESVADGAVTTETCFDDVAVTLSVTVPVPDGVNVTLSPVLPDVNVPPVICHECTIPLRGATLAWPLAPAHKLAGAWICDG